MFGNFVGETSGSVLVEALIVLPIVLVFSVGVLEFGNILWQREQMQTGVRDAARYWSRCRPDFSSCSISTARNIAFYGNPTGAGNLRVPNWFEAADLNITPVTPVGSPQADDLVVATGQLDYLGSPMFRMLAIQPISVRYQYSQRYIGW